LPAARKLRLAGNDRDLVLLHQERDAVRQAARNLARALDDLCEIEAEIVGREAEFAQPVHQMPDFRGAQQRLGRDAAPVEADAAQLVALDDRGLEAQLRRADRADIARRPAADDDHVECVVLHELRPLRAGQGRAIGADARKEMGSSRS
jgi:hypothetical protein